MKEMTTYERMIKIYNNEEPDRVPVTDWFWDSTIERWKNEGLPADLNVAKHFGLDIISMISVDDIDTSPRFDEYIIEETDTYKIEHDRWGVTKKNFKPVSATFQHLEHKITDRDSWLKVKNKMIPDMERVNWKKLKDNFAKWRMEGTWIQAAPWAGYDTISSRMCSTETILYAMYDDPEWVIDMLNTQADLALDLCQMILDEGYKFDELLWYDDMAYKNGLIFSKNIWEEMIKPYQRRVFDWAHNNGIKIHLHSCGNISSLIPDFIELGLDMLNPLEVKAGMNPVEIKKMYGSKLGLRGGFDARKWENFEDAKEDIMTILPEMIKSGGYVFSSDHSVPDNVSLEDYKKIIDLVKKIGCYH